MSPPTLSDPSGTGTTRRRFAVRIAAAGGVACLIAADLAPSLARAARTKLAPGDIGYQATPRGPQRCELCVNWQPPDACKVVGGAISPSGWCGLFVHRT